MSRKTVIVHVDTTVLKINFNQWTDVGGLKWQIEKLIEHSHGIPSQKMELYHGEQQLDNASLLVQDLGLERKTRLTFDLNDWVPPPPQEYNLKVHFYDLPLPIVEMPVFDNWTFEKIRTDLSKDYGLMKAHVSFFKNPTMLMLSKELDYSWTPGNLWCFGVDNPILYVVYEPPSPHWISGVQMQELYRCFPKLTLEPHDEPPLSQAMGAQDNKINTGSLDADVEAEEPETPIFAQSPFHGMMPPADDESDAGSSDKLQIFINVGLSGDKTIALEVGIRDTIQQVKAKIQDQEGIPTYQQKLVLDDNELEDFTMLLQYNIKDGDTINRILGETFPLQINFDFVDYMDMTKDDILLICKGEDTIDNVKVKIQEVTGIKKQWQYLVLEEDYETPLDDNRTLFDLEPFPPELLVCCVDNDGDSEFDEEDNA